MIFRSYFSSNRTKHSVNVSLYFFYFAMAAARHIFTWYWSNELQIIFPSKTLNRFSPQLNTCDKIANIYTASLNLGKIDFTEELRRDWKTDEKRQFFVVEVKLFKNFINVDVHNDKKWLHYTAHKNFIIMKISDCFIQCAFAQCSFIKYFFICIHFFLEFFSQFFYLFVLCTQHCYIYSCSNELRRIE